MQGQPEDKATPKSKKILPITAVSLSLFLFTRLIPCCLPSTAPDGQERDPGQTGGKTTPSCGSVRNYSIRGLSCNKNKRSPSWHLGQRDNPTPSQAPKWGCLHLQGQRWSVSHQRASQKGTQCCPAHPVPSPLSSVRDHSQKMQRDWTIHTQRLEVKAPEQYVSRVTFSAGKTQHISMQTTVCLECFSYLSKGTCDQSWVWFCFFLKSIFHSISLGFLKFIHSAYYFNCSSYIALNALKPGIWTWFRGTSLFIYHQLLHWD